MGSGPSPPTYPRANSFNSVVAPRVDWLTGAKASAEAAIRAAAVNKNFVMVELLLLYVVCTQQTKMMKYTSYKRRQKREIVASTHATTSRKKRNTICLASLGECLRHDGESDEKILERYPQGSGSPDGKAKICSTWHSSLSTVSTRQIEGVGRSYVFQQQQQDEQTMIDRSIVLL
jgi:hypothetical protein